MRRAANWSTISSCVLDRSSTAGECCGAIPPAAADTNSGSIILSTVRLRWHRLSHRRSGRDQVVRGDVVRQVPREIVAMQREKPLTGPTKIPVRWRIAVLCDVFRPCLEMEIAPNRERQEALVDH